MSQWNCFSEWISWVWNSNMLFFKWNSVTFYNEWNEVCAEDEVRVRERSGGGERDLKENMQIGKESQNFHDRIHIVESGLNLLQTRLLCDTGSFGFTKSTQTHTTRVCKDFGSQMLLYISEKLLSTKHKTVA